MLRAATLSLGTVIFGVLLATDVLAATWKYVEEVDPMTDKRQQFVYGLPDGADPANSPIIRIGCYNPNDAYPMGLSFFWNEPLKKKYRDGDLSLTTITFRQNTDQPRDMVWAMSADQSVTYAPDQFSGALSTLGDAIIGSILPGRQVASATWTPEQMHFTMLNSDRVVFRAYSLRGQNITVTFTMDGYWQAIAPFSDHCQGVAGRYRDASTATPTVTPPPVAAPSPVAAGAPVANSTFTNIAYLDWNKIEDSRLKEQLASLPPLDGKYPMRAQSIMRQVDLAFTNARLIRLYDLRWKSGPLYFYYLLDDNQNLHRLDGTEEAFTSAMQASGLSLNGSNVANYLWFYNFFSRPGGELSLPLEFPDQIFAPVLYDDRHDEVMHDALSHAKRIECLPSVSEFLCDAVIYLGDGIYRAKFVIQHDGGVTVEDRAALASGLPAKVVAPVRVE
ncbi:hypothetical protein [Devosia ginsengisoli]|uniref:Uncharacterized protein n=1 Tax=Devosia ginsengisoli TaxID=400770 RepID=A0A5B8LRF3_9HYPH|nr:hypothetical protein [Devosia ginsengisoli]QDZ10837.1 hypothetical protein FPZ08_08765 [Devosia ginsengisoli]